MSDALLVSNEPIRRRADALVENLAKWGGLRSAVTCAYPAEIASTGMLFDVIAADVPCSGEGMFRKTLEAREEWNAEAPENCAVRQREIIRDIWPALRDGGFLIYSTCTFNPLEDEDNVEWICSALGAQAVELHTDPAWRVAGDTREGKNENVYHFFPHLTRGEGFFLALLRKSGVEAEEKKKHPSRRLPQRWRTLKNAPQLEWLSGISDLAAFDDGNILFALDSRFAEDIACLSTSLHVTGAGVVLSPSATKAGGKKKASNPFPHPCLALSSALSHEAFPDMTLGYEEAVKYLRGETLSPAAALPKGIVTVSYRDLRLGFANNVGTRLNNLYPAAWRIRSTYAPSVAPALEFSCGK